MSRVRVFGELTGDNRSVTVGGRSRNDSIKAWTNFDIYRFGTRPNKKKGCEHLTVDTKEHIKTDSIQTHVSTKSNGGINISVDLPDLTDIPSDLITITIRGTGTQLITLTGLLKVADKE